MVIIGDCMSEYLDMFRDEVERLKKEKREDGLYHEIFERMRKYWLPIPSVSEENYDVVGVDSSAQSVEISSGYTFIVARSCAVSKNKVDRNLKAYLTTGEVNELKSRLMENLEHGILLKNIHPINLVDGSLYGRASHIPREFRNDGFEDFTLIYYDTYVKMMEEVEKKGSKIIGVSKSSSTTFLRDIVVKEMYDEEIEKLGLKGIKEIEELPYLALDRKGKARERAKKLLKDKGYERAYRLILELTRKRPDMSILSRFGVGMSKPVLLGASARARRRHREIERWGKDALQKLFPDVNIDDSHVETVLNYLNLPAFVSFYISFSPGFVLRVDFPLYLSVSGKRMQDVVWPEIMNGEVGDILSIVKSEYADNYVHSVHLFAADKDVRLGYGDFFDKYLAILEEELDIIPSTGSMRYGFRR